MIAKTPYSPVHPMEPILRQPVVPTILLVSHDMEGINFLTKCLGNTYHLSTARNEKLALHLLEKQPANLIIINLQGSDSYNLCERLKSSLHYAHIPVILLVSGSAERIRSLEAGADAFVERPLSAEFIKAQIKNMLANRSRIKDYFANSLFAHMSATSCSKENEAFLNRLNDVILANLCNIDLNVDTLARLMNMSRPTFYRKIKYVSNLTPNELVNVARLNKAAELISATDHKVFEVVKMVGFNSQSNFGKAFLKQFHVTPTEYQQLKKKAHA